MKAAITGATGHVGVNLVRILHEQGHSVRALIHKAPDGFADLPVGKVVGDVTRPETLAAAFEGVDVVFHAAARISITRADMREVVEINVEGTRNVIEACRRTGVRRLVHFSSIEALDARPLDVPVEEARAFVDGDSGSPYAVSKVQGEAEVRRAIAEGMNAVILNPTAVIGPFDLRPSLMGRAFVAFARGRIPMLVDGGFDWVDARDVASAAIAAAVHAPRGGRYIVGGRWASMAELVGLVCGHTKVRPPTLLCPLPIALAWAPVSTALSRMAGGTPLFTSNSLRVLRGNRNVSHARASRDLGYAPRALEETVRDTYAWFRDRGMLPG